MKKLSIRILAALIPIKKWRKSFRKMLLEAEQAQPINNGALPSPGYKRETIRLYAKQYQCTNLIETGTYLGDTLFELQAEFTKLHSIELAEELYKKACARFEKFPNIHLYHGDSANILSQVIASINEKSLFWLDGHYSCGITACGKKETPIMEELDAIFRAQPLGHVILIDDARCFGEEAGYPSIEEVKKNIAMKWPTAEICVANDIIRIVLPQQR